MRGGRWIIAALAGLVCVPAAHAFEVPSGTQMTLQEVLVDKVGDEDWVRFRFVAPAIDAGNSDAPGYDDLEADFPHLCTTLALPYLQKYELSAQKIVISLSDRAVEFGRADPDATQYFEQFRAENGDCIWEAL